MKSLFLLVIMCFFTHLSFAQENKFTEEKNIEVGKMLAKVHAINSFGFKNHLIKTFVVNYTLGYTREDLPAGTKQILYISDTQLGKELSTKLTKIENPKFINLEVVTVADGAEGFDVTVAYGVGDDRTEEAFTYTVAKK
jgi:cadmium resistance protein CadD (predicted permease)